MQLDKNNSIEVTEVEKKKVKITMKDKKKKM